MTDADTLIKLAAKCEAATGPDTGLNFEIWEAVGGTPFHLDYTESIDAALTLVPEGCAWHVGCEIDFTPTARVWGHDVHADEFGATPVIALCIAALRARSLQRKTGEG